MTKLTYQMTARSHSTHCMPTDWLPTNILKDAYVKIIRTTYYKQQLSMKTFSRDVSIWCLVCTVQTSINRTSCDRHGKSASDWLETQNPKSTEADISWLRHISHHPIFYSLKTAVKRNCVQSSYTYRYKKMLWWQMYRHISLICKIASV